jgi:uncharacterized FAD-dependent dehydrogenase
VLRLQNITLDFRHSAETLRRAVLDQLGIESSELVSFRIGKKSIDARKRSHIQFIYQIDAQVRNEKAVLARLGGRRGRSNPFPTSLTECPSSAARGERFCGHAARRGRSGAVGLFAALLLAQAGARPVLFERGKPAVERVRDVAGFWERGQLDRESNVQFGEGGAGTFSDGKLTTQIKERGTGFARCSTS